MLHAHRIDYRIATALERADGATIRELDDALADDGDTPITKSSIAKHLPGLLALGVITATIEPRSGRRVTTFRLARSVIH
ncbi:hypothetical protein U8335_11360 [Roseiconus lacunae]|uniref:hypothetical protein n=1 Tax=Roseiconus lacunae TaxID=2605694 RepID=UPI003086381C|nr:hypothetical protein U8335_11360 [Stieleria sp. HD01]